MNYERFMRTYRALCYTRDAWDALFFAFKLEQMAQEPDVPYWLGPTGGMALRVAADAGIEDIYGE